MVEYQCHICERDYPYIGTKPKPHSMRKEDDTCEQCWESLLKDLLAFAPGQCEDAIVNMMQELHPLVWESAVEDALFQLVMEKRLRWHARKSNPDAPLKYTRGRSMVDSDDNELLGLIQEYKSRQRAKEPIEAILERMNKLGARRPPKSRYSLHKGKDGLVLRVHQELPESTILFKFAKQVVLVDAKERVIRTLKPVEVPDAAVDRA